MIDGMLSAALSRVVSGALLAECRRVLLADARCCYTRPQTGHVPEIAGHDHRNAQFEHGSRWRAPERVQGKQGQEAHASVSFQDGGLLPWRFG